MEYKAWLPAEANELAEEDFVAFTEDVKGQPVSINFGEKIGAVKDVIRAAGGVHVIIEADIDLSKIVFQHVLAFSTDNKWNINGVSLVPVPEKV